MKKIGAVFLSTVFIVGMMNLGGTAKANGPDAIRIKQAKERVLSSKIVKGVKDSGTKRTSVVVELTSPPVAVLESLKKKKELNHRRPNAKRQLSSCRKRYPPLKSTNSTTPSFLGFSASLEGTDIKKLARNSKVKRIYPNTRYNVTMKESGPLVGAPDAWRKKDGKGQPVTGKGLKVAILDTGVDSNHPDLKGKVIGGYDFVDRDKTPQDGNGQLYPMIIH